VLKVEPPDAEPMRVFPEIFATVASHKRSVVLDLKDPAGRARALELAAEADVVVVGWRPGVAERLGVGPEDVRAVNPPVVYCSLSGFGAVGPLAHVAGHDVNYHARAASLSPDGGAPSPSPSPRVPWADLAGGLAAAFAICAAWIGRERTGEGETIDVSMTDLLATWTGTVGGGVLESVGKPVRGLPGYGTFEVADGYVALGVITEPHFWAATCRVLGLDDVADLDVPDQIERSDELRARITEALATEHRDEVVARLVAEGAPASPVLSREEIVADEHFRARGTLRETHLGPAFGHPIRYVDHPARGPAAPPEPGEHQDAGFSAR
jgi:CoA:oxalate CoA-transferase